MNTGKRWLSVLMCIAMLISMMSTFAFAGTDVSDDVTTGVVDVTTLTGAKPTTDVAAPTISASTIVVDSTATADTAYVLEWNGEQYADLFTFGTNLFTTLADAQAAAPVGATYLVKSFADSGKTAFKKAGKYYSEAYNTMPFVVGTAFDGSDWSLNEEYTAKSVTLNGVDFIVTDAAQSGSFELYGFTVDYASYAYDFNNSTVAMDVLIQNSLYLPKASSDTIWMSMGTFAKTDVAADSHITFKNFYLGGSTARFATEYFPNYFTLDGFYVPADIDSCGASYPYIKQGYNSKASHLVFKNMNIQNDNLIWYFQGNNQKNYFVNTSDAAISGATNNKDFRAITIENCTFNNSSTLRLSTNFLFTYANAISMYNIKGNRIINTTGTAVKLFTNNSPTYGNHLGLDMQNNYFQGFLPADSFASNVGNGSSCGITIKNNYLTDGVSEIGTEFYVDSTADTRDWHATDWYLDGAMTLKATDILAESAPKAKDCIIDQKGFDVTVYVPTGKTADIKLTGAIAAYANDDGAVDALTAGTYTMTVTKVVDEVEYAVDYNLAVVEYSAPLIQYLEEDTGLIDSDKILFVDGTTNDAANGSLVEVTWKGETYSAVKGVTAFANLDAAQDYAKTNGITDANFLIKSAMISGNLISGETEWNTFPVVVPGKYFTQNYDKKPYVASDRALDPDGSDWASNVNTGEADSFNTADGIEVKWLTFNNAVAGNYELYGFTLTNCIQDDAARSGSIDVLIQNLYIPKANSSAVFTTASSKFSSYATANTYNDKMYIKDVYFDGANNEAYKKGFFQSGDTYLWATTVLDGVFADFAGYTDGGNHWVNQYYDEHNFTVKNSNFRNAQEKIMVQGDNGKGANKGTGDATYREFEKQWIMENNIFYNFTFSGNYTNAFAYVKQNYHTVINFNDNFVYTGRSDKVVNLFNGTGGDDRQPNTFIRVDNNTLLGVNNSYNINRWVSTVAPHTSGTKGNYVTADLITAEDVLAGNIDSVGQIFIIYSNNHSGGVKNYTQVDATAWLDYQKTTKASDITSNIKAYVPDGGFYILDATGSAISAKLYLPSTITAADITINDMSPVWLDTEGNEVDGTEITKESVNIVDEHGDVIGADYVLQATAYAGAEEDPIEITFNINVNIVPNTIDAYPASDYVKQEAGLVNDKMTYTMTHPTEKETIEDMPHISGGLIDEYGMINSVNAAIIDGVANYSQYKYTITAGEYKQFEWAGTTYLAKFGESLYQNADAAYTAEARIGNIMPEYLLTAGEWGNVTSDGYYGGTGGQYFLRSPGKFFTENYWVDPYYAGDEYGNDWTANIGTEYGQFNPDAYIKAAYLSIDNDAKPGRYEVYGFTIGTGVRDSRTTNVEAIDLYLKNTYFPCDAANSYIFYTNESTNQAVMNGSPDSKLYIENAYIASKGDRSFLRNSAWSDVTFDKVYADFADNTKKNTSYFHQTYDEFSLVIKNSFFTNTLTDLTYFEGYNDGTNYFGGHAINGNMYAFKEGKKSLVLENNIFKDYSFNGTGSFMNVKGGYFSEIILKGNYIDNTGNSMTLINGIDSFQGVDPLMNLVIEDNTLIGFNGKTGYGLRALTDTSSIKDNYTSDVFGGTGIGLTTTDGTTAGAYYLDAYKEYKSTDLEITEWTTEGVDYAITNSASNHTVLVRTEGGVPTIADAVAAGELTVYSDATLETQIDDLLESGTSYVKVATVNSNDEEVAIVYQVTVLGVSDNFFADVYVAPETDTIKTPIDASKAIIVDYAVNEASFGEVVTVSWQDVEYDFIKGVNAFATITDATAYVNTNGIEHPHVLMKTINASAPASYNDVNMYGNKAAGEWNIQMHGSFYTENYNKVPYTVTDGVWAVNEDYDLNDGITARWIKVNNNLKAGSVELYGFAVTAAFQNTGENSSGTSTEAVDFYIENCYADSTIAYSAPRAPFQADSKYVRTPANPAGGSFYAKNVYVSSANDRSRTLIHQANYASDFTLDGVFIDNSQATELYDRGDVLDEAKVILEGDSTFTVKNCYASDAKYSTRFVVLVEEHDTTDNNHSVVFDNNTFKNVTFGGDQAFIQVDGDYTDVSITNNTIINDFDVPNVVEVIEYIETAGTVDDGTFSVTAMDTVSVIDLTLTIENNVLVGFGAHYETDRYIDEASSAAGNYIALNGKGGKMYTVESYGDIVVKDESFRVNEEGTMSTSDIYEMTFDGAAFDTNGQTANAEVKYNAEYIDINDYLVNPYNEIVVYEDSAMTVEADAANLPIDTTVVYIKVMSPDMTVTETRIATFGIADAPAPEVAAVSATLYNDIALNFKTVGTDILDGVYMTFTLNGETTTVTDYVEEGDYLVFNFAGLAPHLMTDTITAKIYAGETELSSYETTVAAYLEGIKDEYADYYELYKLAIDVLNYGAAAQQYRGYKLDTLANANLTDDEKYIEEAFVEDNFEIIVNEEIVPLVEWKAIGLYLDEAIDMKLAFTTEEDIETIKAIVKDADGNVVEEITSFVNRNGRYYIYFDGFNMAQVDDVFTFVIVDADGNALSDAVNYSVQSYAYTAIEQGGDTLKNIVTTMMNVGRSAVVYRDLETM